jgi:hypothetical protein
VQSNTAQYYSFQCFVCQCNLCYVSPLIRSVDKNCTHFIFPEKFCISIGRVFLFCGVQLRTLCMSNERHWNTAAIPLVISVWTELSIVLTFARLWMEPIRIYTHSQSSSHSSPFWVRFSHTTKRAVFIWTDSYPKSHILCNLISLSAPFSLLSVSTYVAKSRISSYGFGPTVFLHGIYWWSPYVREKTNVRNVTT